MRLTLEKVLVLKNVSAFKDVAESALGDFILACEEVAFAANKDIIKKGEENRFLYVVLHGVVRIHDGETLLSEVEQRQMFGEMTALHPSPVNVTVTAETETVMLRIGCEKLYEIMSLHPSITKGLMKVFINRLQLLDNRHI